MGTLVHWYSFDSTRQERSKEYQADRFKVSFEYFCDIVQFPGLSEYPKEAENI